MYTFMKPEQSLTGFPCIARQGILPKLDGVNDIRLLYPPLPVTWLYVVTVPIYITGCKAALVESEEFQ